MTKLIIFIIIILSFLLFKAIFRKKKSEYKAKRVDLKELEKRKSIKSR
jgi:short subunit fatty acids transporter